MAPGWDRCPREQRKGREVSLHRRGHSGKTAVCEPDKAAGALMAPAASRAVRGQRLPFEPPRLCRICLRPRCTTSPVLTPSRPFLCPGSPGATAGKL